MKTKQYSMFLLVCGLLLLLSYAKGEVVMRPDPTATACSTTGSISGRVTDEKQQPLSGVQVTLYRYRLYAYHSFRDFICCRLDYYPYALPSLKVTDAQGNYRLTDLQPGLYRVAFELTNAHYPKLFFGNTPKFDDARGITVTAQLETSGIDMQLLPGASISGTVRNEQGEALKDIPVIASTDEFNSYWFSLFNSNATGQYSQLTDSSGRYQLSGMQPATYSVSLGLNPATYSADPSSNSITLASGGGRTVDWKVKVIQTPNGKIEGTVLDEHGQPLAGVTVMASNEDASGIPDGQFYYATSDGAGHYRIPSESDPGMANGTYVLRFSVNFGEIGNKLSVQVSDNATTQVAPIQLPVGIKLSGLTTKTDAGNTEVTLYRLEQGSWQIYRSIFAIQDYYLFLKVAPGTYRLGFKPHIATGYLQTFYPDASRIEEAKDITLTETSSLSLNTPLLVAGSITGKLPEEMFKNSSYFGGQPVLYRLNNGQWQPLKKYSDYSHIGLAGNNYRITGLQSGRYRLGFQLNGPSDFMNRYYPNQNSVGLYFISFYPDTRYLERAGDIVLAQGETVKEIDLVLSGISGTLTDNLQQPVINRTVSLYTYNPLNSSYTRLKTVKSNDQGHYRFAGLESGHYYVGIEQKPGLGTSAYYEYDSLGNYSYGQSEDFPYATQFYTAGNTPAIATPIEFVEGQSVSNINMQITSGGCVGGQLHDTQGHPLAHVLVHVSPESYDVNKYGIENSGYTDAEGRYLVNGLLPGRYIASFERIDLGNSSYQNQKAFEIYDASKTNGIDATFTAVSQCRNTSLSADNSLSAASYDFNSGLLTIPRINANGRLFEAKLKNIGGFVFQLLSSNDISTDPRSYFWLDALFDKATGFATLPYVKAGDTNYCVQLRQQSNGLFALEVGVKLP